ncbi:hypothetical protein M501DRAFT_929521 [Patellaria atrata CBS 101060]|uniref:Gamma-glutamylcyclotransferase AIG2-like domain-containing protein n=1 Tax=Patellaria atrata CBS 101060 TaxID=1346257 RepID=A0A9P4SEX8_9PEZI|nr:hypothetical protein M501DRAFT_929521 [Patellaria atrata CBS 101060]
MSSQTIPPSLPTATVPATSPAHTEGSFRLNAVMNRAASVDKQDHTERRFEPCHMFFYGSPMDTEVLQAILKLSKTPIAQRGMLEGFSMKMWSIYHALIKDVAGKVEGTVWYYSSEAHFRRLAQYETSVYTWCECEAELKDVTTLSGCRAFC